MKIKIIVNKFIISKKYKNFLDPLEKVLFHISVVIDNFMGYNLKLELGF